MNLDIILKEIKNETWIETNNEDELKKKITYWQDKLLELFPRDHEVFSMLAEISFEPKATDPALYGRKKLEAIENGKKALVRLFEKIPELYNQIPLMDLSFEEIIKRDESHYLEYKPSMIRGIRGGESGPDRIMKSIAAFLNSDGGVLVIGIGDNKKVIGINQDYEELDKYMPMGYGFQQNSDGFENCFITLLKKYGFSDRIINEFIVKGIKFHKIKELDICMISIKKSDEPVFIKVQKSRVQNSNVPVIANVQNKDLFFVREGNSSRSLQGVKEIVDYVFKHFR
jgi:hypothetical protein